MILQKKYLLIAAVIFFVIPTVIIGCGIYLINVYEAPDLNSYRINFPEEELWHGSIHVIQPNWGMRYLYPAYRALQHQPLSVAEQGVLANYYPVYFGGQDPSAAFNEWTEKRNALWSEMPLELAFQPMYDNYQSYDNCLADAFRTATQALHQRAETYTKEDLRWWIRNQDIVFGSCFDTAGSLVEPSVHASRSSVFRGMWHRFLSWFGVDRPSVVPDVRSVKLLDDLQYQRAQLAMYSGHEDQSAEQFAMIMKDTNSAWRYQAGYGYARSLIRRANESYSLYFHKNNDELPSEYQQALKQLEAMQNDSLWRDDEGIRRLINFVTIRIDPVRRLLDADGELRSPATLAQTLDDIDTVGYWHDFSESDIKNLFKRADDGQHDAILWLAVFRYPAPEAYRIAESRYQTTKSSSWVLALARQALADQKGKDLEKITQYLGAISKTDPGYLSAQYYRGQIYITLKQYANARQLADNILQQKKYANMPDVLNLFNDIGMQASSELVDALTYSSRKIVYALGDGEVTMGGENLEVAAVVRNRLNFVTPLDQWLPAIQASSLPQSLKASLYKTAIFRSFLMKLMNNETDRYRYIHSLLIEDTSVDPDVLDGSENFYRGWCLSTEKIENTISERATLTRTVPINAVGEELLTYAKTHTDEQTLPETLHLFVARTRYEQCKDDDTGVYSKKAFRFLHDTYPGNPWTIKTKYWYN